MASYLIPSHGEGRKNVSAPSGVRGPKRSGSGSRVPRRVESRDEEPVSCLLTESLSQHSAATQDGDISLGRAGGGTFYQTGMNSTNS